MNHCAICNKEIKRKNTHNSKRMYCSRICAFKGASLYPSKPKTGIYTTCGICNSEFYISKCFIGKRKFCSKKCANKSF